MNVQDVVTNGLQKLQVLEVVQIQNVDLRIGIDQEKDDYFLFFKYLPRII